MYFLKSYYKNHLEKKKCDILVVSSCGGHLKQIVDLEDAYKTKSVFFAMSARALNFDDIKADITFVTARRLLSFNFT